MATKLTTTRRVYDDVTNEMIEQGTRITYAVHGQDYELDLDEDNLRRFEADMAAWSVYARKVGKPRKLEAPRRISTEILDEVAIATEEPAPSVPAKRRGTNPNVKRPGIKEWAAANGFGPVKGRTPLEVERAYDAAQKKAAA